MPLQGPCPRRPNGRKSTHRLLRQPLTPVWCDWLESEATTYYYCPYCQDEWEPPLDSEGEYDMGYPA